MISLVSSELFKIYARRKWVWMLVIGMVFACLVAFGLAIVETPETAEAIGRIPSAQSFPEQILELWASFLLPLFAIMIVADLIAEESGQGTLKLPLLYPVSRLNLITAKIVATGLVLVSYLLVLMGFAYGIGLIAFDSLPEAGPTLLVTIGAYLAVAFPVLVFAVWVMLLSLFVSSTGAVIGIGFGGMMLLNMLATVWPPSAHLLLTQHFFGYRQLLFAVAESSWRDYGISFVITLVYGIVGLVLLQCSFRRKDLLC